MISRQVTVGSSMPRGAFPGHALEAAAQEAASITSPPPAAMAGFHF
jgi:hypothetical protein